MICDLKFQLPWIKLSWSHVLPENPFGQSQVPLGWQVPPFWQGLLEQAIIYK